MTYSVTFLIGTNIFIGYNLERAKLPQSVIWVTIVPVVIAVIVFIVLEVKKWMSKGKSIHWNVQHLSILEV